MLRNIFRRRKPSNALSVAIRGLLIGYKNGQSMFDDTMISHAQVISGECIEELAALLGVE